MDRGKSRQGSQIHPRLPCHSEHSCSHPSSSSGLTLQDLRGGVARPQEPTPHPCLPYLALHLARHLRILDRRDSRRRVLPAGRYQKGLGRRLPRRCLPTLRSPEHLPPPFTHFSQWPSPVDSTCKSNYVYANFRLHSRSAGIAMEGVVHRHASTRKSCHLCISFGERVGRPYKATYRRVTSPNSANSSCPSVPPSLAEYTTNNLPSVTSESWGHRIPSTPFGLTRHSLQITKRISKVESFRHPRPHVHL